MPLVGWILVIMAGGSVGLVLYLVMREQEVHEEWYIPPQGDSPASHKESVPEQRTAEESH